MTKGTKAAIITTLAGGSLGALAWIFTRKVKDAEEASGQYKAAADAAKARADQAEGQAREAAEREAAARHAAISAGIAAEAAGRAAQNAVNAANQAIAQANAASSNAGSLLAQAQAASGAQRAALEAEANRQQQIANGLNAEIARLRREAEQRLQDAEREKQKQTGATVAAQVEEEKKTTAIVAAQAEREQADTIQEVGEKIQQILTPPPPPRPGPAPVSTPNELSPEALEMKRRIIAQIFQELVAAIRKRNPSWTQQKAVNEAARLMRLQNIVLDAPNPRVSFWQLPAEEIRRQASNVVNLYNGKKPVKPKITEEVSKVPEAKLTPVRTAYEKAVVDTLAAAQSKNQKLTVENAFVPVIQSFASFGIPSPQDLNEDHLFWANPVASIQRAADEALNYHRQQIYAQTGYQAPGWTPRTVSVSELGPRAGTVSGALGYYRPRSRSSSRVIW
jgi:hypothetical protein